MAMECRAASEVVVGSDTENRSPAATKTALATAFPDKAEEVYGDDEAEVTVRGALPAWLAGSYVRNGAGVMKGMGHMFSGYAMLFKMRFDAGKAFASQRMVQTKAYTAFERDGKMRFGEIGTVLPIWEEVYNAVMGVTGLGDGFTDNAGVSVAPVPGTNGKELIAMTESVCGQYRVDGDSLATKSQVTYDDDLNYMDVSTAHPTILPDGTAINVLQDMIGGKYVVAKYPFGGSARESIAEIPRSAGLPGNSWIHDFPVTEHYAIIPETPVTLNLVAFMNMSADYIVFDWTPTAPTKFHVVPLDGSGDVTTFLAPPFFTFHYINAFETEVDGSKAICIDIPWYDDPEFINGLKMDRITGATTPVKDIEKGTLKRVTLNFGDRSRRASVSDLCPDHASFGNSLEMPAINRAYKGKEHRYAYVDCATPPTIVYNSVAKIDARERRVVGTFRNEGGIVGEPFFVPRPGAEEEDDGVVLVAYTAPDGSSHMAVLDGQTFEEVALLDVPHKVPYGFHATFVPTA